MPDPIATVVIPNYNGMRFLPRLLESLAAQSRRDFEIVLVDDGSSDESVEWIRRARPDVHIVQNATNLGFAGACNAGIRSIERPLVALLNNDTHVDRGWFEHAVAAFDDPAIGAVQSLVVLAGAAATDGERIDSAGDGYSVAGGAFKRLHGEPVARAGAVPVETFSACGASAFYRRAALREVGLLDEDFVSYYEDVELGFRLRWAGWRCVLAPRSVCHHHLNASYSPDGWAMHFHSARNAEIVWWAHMGPRLRRKYLTLHVLMLALQLAADTYNGRARAFLAGKLAAWRLGARITEKRRQRASYVRVDERTIEAALERDWWGVHVRPKIRKLLAAVRGP